MRKLLTIIVGVLVGMCGGEVRADPPPTRHISVAVTVLKPGAVAVEGAAVALGVDKFLACGTSNADGHVILSADIDPNIPRLDVCVVLADPKATTSESRLNMRVYRELTESFALSRRQSIVLVPLQTEYAVTFQALDGVVATGRVTGDNGCTNCVLVQRRDASDPGTVEPTTGNFRVGGIPKGGACDIVIHGLVDGRVREVHISPSQSTADVNMGTIALISSGDTAEVRLRVSDIEKWPVGLAVLPKYLCLVSFDGEVVRQFPVLASGVVSKTVMSANENPKVPPGSYLVVPGTAAYSWPLAVIRDRLRSAGGLPSVQAAGVPSVVVSGSDTVTSVSIESMLSAAKAVRGY